MRMEAREPQKRKTKRLTGRMQGKLLLVFCVIILLFVVLIGRLIYLNYVDGDRYTKKVLSQQSYVSSVIPYKRGSIVDCKDTVLAKSVRVYNLILDPKQILTQEGKKEGTTAATLMALNSCFGIDSTEMTDILREKPNSRYAILKKGVTYEETLPFLTMQEENSSITGAWFEAEYVREYPLGTVASNVIGFTTSDNQGHWGIEEYYSDELTGTNGREYGYYDQELNLERIVKEAENGNTIVTTIDATVQQKIENQIQKFQKEIGSKNAAVVIMNPNNGEILAMAANQPYNLNDPRNLEKYYTKAEIAEMTDVQTLEALNGIWRNYCISDVYEPGSTFKPYTLAMALEEDLTYDGEKFICDGGEEILGQTIACVKRVGHGEMTLKEALEVSCNDVFMQIGARIGRTQFDKYQRNMGIGSKTMIDLPGEANGIVFTEETLNPQELATSSFGQGMTATMIQMISGFSSLLNGGNYYKPYVVKEIRNDSGATIETIEAELVRKTVTKETSDLLLDYLYGTVEEGTAKSVQIPGYKIGGKTGTAEKQPRKTGLHLVSFMGCVPADDPEIVIYVTIDEPNVENQATSIYATNLARDIMVEVLPILGIYPTEELTEEVTEEVTEEISEETSQDDTTDGADDVAPTDGQIQENEGNFNSAEENIPSSVFE